MPAEEGIQYTQARVVDEDVATPATHSRAGDDWVPACAGTTADIGTPTSADQFTPSAPLPLRPRSRKISTMLRT